MKKTKIFLLNLVIKRLFNGITEEDILVQRNGRFFIGRHRLTEQEVYTLKTDATFILDSEMWKTLVKCMKYEANRQMYEKSKNVEDMIFGKAVLWTIDIMEKKLKNIIKQ